MRALRHRSLLRQVDIARRAGVAQATVSLIERGDLDGLTLRTLRRVVMAVGASYVQEVRWEGAGLDRLLDAQHAAIVDAITRYLVHVGWAVMPEVSYSEYGERGSIDLLAWHESTRTLLVIEVKSQLGAVEMTIRKLDEKARLAPIVASRRFGWRAARTARLLVLPEGMTNRRHISRHEASFAAAFPVQGRQVRTWLREPDRAISGLWFLSLSDGGAARGARTRRSRVHRPRRVSG